MPHVASEQGWTITETLESLARKAGYRNQITKGMLDKNNHLHDIQFRCDNYTDDIYTS